MDGQTETGVILFFSSIIDSIIDKRTDPHDYQPTYFFSIPPSPSFPFWSTPPFILYHDHRPCGTLIKYLKYQYCFTPTSGRVPAKRTREGLGVSSSRRFLLNFYTFLAIFPHFCIVPSVSSSPLLKMVDFHTQGNFIALRIDLSQEIFYRNPEVDIFQWFTKFRILILMNFFFPYIKYFINFISVCGWNNISKQVLIQENKNLFKVYNFNYKFSILIKFLVLCCSLRKKIYKKIKLLDYHFFRLPSPSS